MVNKNDSEESVPLEASFKENSQKLDIQQSAEEGANGTDSGEENGNPVVPEDPDTLENFFVTTDESVESYVDINMNFLRVSNVGAPTELEHEERSRVADRDIQTYSNDAVRLADTKNLLLRPEYASNIQCLMLRGGTMQGDIDMDNHPITGIDDYYYSGEPKAIASGAALETAVLDYAGSWLSAKQELQNLNSKGLDELEKDLGVQNGTTDINADTCKLLLRDGKSTMTGDLIFVDQDLVGGPVDDFPEDGGNGGSGEGSDGSEEVISGNAEEGIGNENGGEVGSETENETEEEIPTEPVRNPTIIGLKNPEKETDIVTRKYVDSISNKLLLIGGTVSGDINANNYSIANLKEHDKQSRLFPNAKSFFANRRARECEILNFSEKSLDEDELDEDELVTALDVLRSFENKYVLEYFCHGLNFENQSRDVLEDGIYEKLRNTGSSGSSSYWSSCSETSLKIKKGGVFLLSFNVSGFFSEEVFSSDNVDVITLKMTGISGSSVQGDEEILAKFSLSSAGSVSSTVLVYVDPKYIDEGSDGVSVSIELDDALSDKSVSWQISFIENISQTEEDNSVFGGSIEVVDRQGIF
ncbi:hypothetical protein [Chlamydiifrater volucris]|uniref:hypothetical protein n=1 Tax=Chlamydiifrater volucris TaxID=2681470 RepID=UPI0032B1D93F